MTRLSVEGLCVERGGRRILEAVSFGLAPGEMINLLGANGAGKSTLLRSIAGLLAIEAGTIRFDGSDQPVSEQTHYFGHLDVLKSSLTVAGNLSLFGAIVGAPGLSIAEALARVGLEELDDTPAGYLSAGQRRRVGLARMLLVNRPLWLLDEPTSALDAASEATFGELLAAHLAAGGLAIAATHRPLPVTPTFTLTLGAAA